MIGCNCGPITAKQAELIESMNVWVKLNEQWLQSYLAWCQLYYPMSYIYRMTKNA